MKMWRTQFSSMLKNEDVKNLVFLCLKNEDKTLPHLLKMKIAFCKMLKTEDMKTHVKDTKKMKTASCAESSVLHGQSSFSYFKK